MGTSIVTIQEFGALACFVLAAMVVMAPVPSLMGTRRARVPRRADFRRRSLGGASARLISLATATVGLLVLATACGPVPSSERVDLNPNGVIFPAEATDAELGWISGESAGSWTPTEADVAALEEALVPFLRQAKHPWLRPDPPIWERVPQYYRQYLGVVEDGERVIFANFFCHVAEGQDWQRELVFVMDGGDCYFSLKYDPQQRRFFDLNVNGEA